MTQITVEFDESAPRDRATGPIHVGVHHAVRGEVADRDRRHDMPSVLLKKFKPKTSGTIVVPSEPTELCTGNFERSGVL